MISPKYEGHRSPAGHLLLPNETCCTGIELHLIEFLTRGVPWELPKKTHTVTKKVGCYPKALRAKPTSDDHIFTSRRAWRS